MVTSHETVCPKLTPTESSLMKMPASIRASVRHAALALLVGSVAFAAKGGGGKPGGGTEPPPPPANPVLTGVVDGYVLGMNDDGSNAYVIAEIGAPNDVPGPAWSPDGTQVAFFYYGGQLKIAEADGSQILTDVPGVAWDRWWDTYTTVWRTFPNPVAGSPGVEKIIYANRAHTEDEEIKIWAVSPDGDAKQVLYHRAEWIAYAPSLNHDGTKLAFTARPVNRSADYHFYVIAVETFADTDDKVKLRTVGEPVDYTEEYNLPEGATYFQWANKSDKFAFSAKNAAGIYQLYVFDPGTETIPPSVKVLNLSPVEQHRRQPSWSPNDSELVFTGLDHRKFKKGTYRVLADGSGSVQFITSAIRAHWWPGL